LRGLYFNGVRLEDHLLLFVALKKTSIHCVGAQALNRTLEVRFLSHESLS
jgi:hypothetical protein